MGFITALDHVQVAMPTGGEDLARDFYSGVLGLAEIPKPEVLAMRGGVWFQCGSAELHLGADPTFKAAQKAHPALVVNDFAGLLAHLDAHNISAKTEDTVNGRLRANITDPFGNRIELIAP